MEIIKKFEDRLANEGKEENPFVDLAKAEVMGILKEKRVTMEGVENGFIVRVSMDVEFGEGEKRDWRYISKSYIFPDVKTAMTKMEEEMTNFKPGQKVKMSELVKVKDVKVRAVSKKMLTIVVGESDGHVHFATGDIINKTVDGKLVKFFKGETLEQAVYWKIGKPEEGSNETEFTRSVASNLAVHKHSFSFELSKDDESGKRIMGSTSEDDGHFHLVDILDIWSVHTSNAPDTGADAQ